LGVGWYRPSLEGLLALVRDCHLRSEESGLWSFSLRRVLLRAEKSLQ